MKMTVPPTAASRVPTRLPGRKEAIVIAVAVLGIAATVCVGVMTQQSAQARHQAVFQQLATERLALLDHRLDGAADSVLMLASHFRASAVAASSADAYASFVAPSLARHPYVTSLAWAPRIVASRRAAFEQEGAPRADHELGIAELSADGKRIRAAARDEYFPVQDVGPATSPLVGIDQAADPAVDAAIRAARDSGVMTVSTRRASGPVNAPTYSVVLVAPVFDLRTADTIEGRRQGLLGVALASVRVADLVVGADGDSLRHVMVHVYDAGAKSSEAQLYPSRQATAPTALGAGPYVLSRTVAFGDRAWQIVATPTPSFPRAGFSMAALFALAAGFLLTAAATMALKRRLDLALEFAALGREQIATGRRLSETQKLALLGSIERQAGSSRWYVSAEAATLLGLTERPLSLPLNDLLGHVDPEDRKRLWDILSVEPTPATRVDTEFRLTADGVSRVIHAVGATLIGDEGEATRILLTLQDVSARRGTRKNWERREARRPESRQSVALGTLAGGIAEEIMGPVKDTRESIAFLNAGIERLLDLALSPKRGGGLSAAGKLKDLNLAYLAKELPLAADAALAGVTQIGTMVEAMQALTQPRPEAPEAFDLHHVVTLATTVTRHQWKPVSVLIVEPASDVPMIVGVADEIREVLLHLIANAAHAIAAKGEGAMGQIVIRTRTLGVSVELEVRDSGLGLTSAQQNQLFVMARGGPAPALAPGGRQSVAGIAAIVRRHGGTLTAESDGVFGACFRVVLPIHGAATLPSSATAAA